MWKILLIILRRKNAFIVFSLFFIVLSIGLIIFSIVKYYPWLGTKVYSNIGEVSGYSVWIGIVSYLIWRFVFKRKQGTGLLCFSILLLLISSYKFLDMLYEVKEGKIVVKEVSSMGKDIFDNKDIQSRDYDSKSYGKWAPLLQVLNEEMRQLQTNFLELDKEIKEQDIETMLAQQTLEDINRIRKAQERLQKVRQILDRYEIMIRQRYRELDAKLSNLNIPNMDKEEFLAFLAGYNDTKNERDQNNSELFRIRRAFVSEMNNLLDFLKGREGYYYFENGQILFVSQENVHSYNQYIQSITNLANEETSLVERVQQSFIGWTKTMKGLK